MSIIENAGLILLSQLAAPAMAMDFPSLHSLQITSAKTYPKEFTKHYYDYLLLEDPQELPERLIIKGRVAKKSGGGIFIIGINLEDNTIVEATWDALNNKPYYGSAAIGIVIFGLPGLIISSPLIIATYILYGLLKKISGMNKDSLAIYLKLRNQLSEENKKLLKLALKNHGRY